MYTNIGRKLKSLAKIVGIGGLLISICFFLYFCTEYNMAKKKLVENSANINIINQMKDYDYNQLKDYIINYTPEGIGLANKYNNIIIGSLIIGVVCLISTWPLYGFGQLIETNMSIEKHLSKMLGNQEMSNTKLSSLNNKPDDRIDTNIEMPKDVSNSLINDIQENRLIAEEGTIDKHTPFIIIGSICIIIFLVIIFLTGGF
jgi:hypothetical protein